MYVSDLGGELSAKDLEVHSKRLGGFLQASGIDKGDRVAVMLPNILQYPVAIHAVLRIGAVLVNVNPLYTKAELEYLIEDSGAKAIIAFNGAHEQVKDLNILKISTGVGDLLSLGNSIKVNLALKALKGHRKFGVALKGILAYPHSCDVVSTHGSDLALIQYTGGTTGKPKGVMLTHNNITANGNQILDRMGSTIGDGDVIINPLPLYHVYSFIVSIMYLPKVNAKTLLVANPRDIKGFIKTLKKNYFTGFIGLNTLFNAILFNEDSLGVDWSNLKVSLSGGMALSPDVAARWAKTTGSTIFQGYGLTETSPVVCLDDPDDITEGTVGKPVKDVKVKIAGNGELLVKGPNVMKGYWNNEEETKKAFTTLGWFKTGDIAKIEDGKVVITDRLKNMIIVSGFNVYPTEVEDVLTYHPDVAEACVIGVEDNGSERIVAYIVGDADEENLREFCKTYLTNYKIPKEYVYVSELPKTPVGKVLHRKVKEMYVQSKES